MPCRTGNCWDCQIPCMQLHDVFLMTTLSTAALLHRKPASIGTSHNSYSAHNSNRRNAV